VRAARLPADHDPATVTGGSADIVVTIEEASAADRLNLFARAHCLTVREHEPLGLLATGGDTRAIARQMSLSGHTAPDHMKSIFNQTRARNRVTLQTRALGTKP
jgi:DNA-binding CsgD family transcriptional regulator